MPVRRRFDKEVLYLPPFFHAEKANGRGGADNGGDDRRERGEEQSGAQCLLDPRVLKKLKIPA